MGPKRNHADGTEGYFLKLFFERFVESFFSTLNRCYGQFYYCSGSDFVEMYVGRGAARVRKLFVKAGKSAPCIVFLDELDAMGKERSSGGGGRQVSLQ